MVSVVFFFLAALTVRDNPTPVRAGCAASEAVVANLPAGTPVEIRFRLADGSDCLKIAAPADKGEVVGYVSGSALEGLDAFEKERSAARAAGPLDGRNPLSAPPVLKTELRMTGKRDPEMERASSLLGANEPDRALELLEPAVKRDPNNPNLLLLAGLAAYRSDQLDTALDYWKRSLASSPNPSLEHVYERVKREAESNSAGEKLVGMHIALRYERQTISVDTARGILSVLDAEYSRISAELGCSTGERVIAIVQDRNSYLRSTGAADWSGGWYDGRIHIAWTDEKEVGPQMRRGLAHELVHACLTSIPSGPAPWPAWLQEGLAQKLSGDRLEPAAREQLRQHAQARQVPRLEELHPDWSSMSVEEARQAYNLSLAAAYALYEDYAVQGIRNILSNPQKMSQVTAELDKKLGF